MGGNKGGATKCGLTEMVIFAVALVSGTACSICSKTMMELRSTGIRGEADEVFNKPIFQTFAMFAIMTTAILMHHAVLQFRIPFPGYHYPPLPTTPAVDESTTLLSSPKQATNVAYTPKSLPWSLYWLLLAPSVFDLAATAFCMMGLQYLDVSIYQMLRGSSIIFVALMKQNILKHRVYGFQWIGVFWNVVAVFFVGWSAMLNNSVQTDDDSAENSSLALDVTTSQTLLGVSLVLLGAFVQSCQLVFEEKVMTDLDIPAPPLFLIGMEGFWGSFLCLVVVYPLAYFLPGSDYGGCYENPWNTWVMLTNSTALQQMCVLYFISIFTYNVFVTLVTFLLSSIWHTILDNFRPLTIWAFDLFLFYVLSSGVLGEAWKPYSYVQILSFVALVYGTAIYNAPHPGSIHLRGEWFSCCGLFDFSKDYDAIQGEIDQATENDFWVEQQQSFQAKRMSSSFYGERSIARRV